MWKKIFFSFVALLTFGAVISFWQKPAATFDFDCIAQSPDQSIALIIIPGSKEKIPPLFQGLARKFYSAYGVSIDENDWPEKLRDYLTQNSDLDICIFNWSGGITETFSLKPAAKALAERLDRDDHRRLILFGKSLGGLVGERAIQALKVPDKVSRLIYVATPHRHAHLELPQGIEIVNIFSEADRYLTLANKILYFGTGVTELKNAENEDIPGLTHSEFNENREIQVENSRKINLKLATGTF